MKHPVDAHVGKRVRHRRWMMGMTQQQLGDLVGIKFQQIQKYETGMNRISASRLWDIAKSLEVPISYFFEGLDADSMFCEFFLQGILTESWRSSYQNSEKCWQNLRNSVKNQRKFSTF